MIAVKILMAKKFGWTLDWADLQWSDFIRADINMGARASSAQWAGWAKNTASPGKSITIALMP